MIIATIVDKQFNAPISAMLFYDEMAAVRSIESSVKNQENAHDFDVFAQDALFSQDFLSLSDASRVIYSFRRDVSDKGEV